MDSIITLAGIRELYKKQKQGEPLPDDWKELAEEYLSRKKIAIEKFGQDWDKDQRQEAMLIIKLLLGDENV